MGTNYYLVKNGPTVNHGLYHIGKSSAGWLFKFQDQDCPWGKMFHETAIAYAPTIVPAEGGTDNG